MRRKSVNCIDLLCMSKRLDRPRSGRVATKKARLRFLPAEMGFWGNSASRGRELDRADKVGQRTTQVFQMVCG